MFSLSNLATKIVVVVLWFVHQSSCKHAAGVYGYFLEVLALLPLFYLSEGKTHESACDV
jgi:hypothetical protein